MTTRPIGIVGTGTMGRPIAARILAAGHPVLAYDAFPGATDALRDAGAGVAGTVAEVARACEMVLMSLPGPAQIREVALGDQGILAHAAAGSVLVDLSTSSVDLARALAARSREAGVAFVDAPVSGGAAGAKAGTLSVLVGVDDDAVWARVAPILECFGRKIVRAGPAGAGTLLKLINNQIFLCTSVLMQEGFVLGAKAGMHAADIMAVLNESSAAVYTRKAGFVLDRRFDAELFKLSIAAKDVRMALESAAALEVPMPMTAAAATVYEAAIAQGFGDNIYSATLRTLEAWAGAEVDPLA